MSYTVYENILESRQVGGTFKSFCVPPTLVCLLPINILYNGFLRMETQHEVGNELFAKR